MRALAIGGLVLAALDLTLTSRADQIGGLLGTVAGWLAPWVGPAAAPGPGRRGAPGPPPGWRGRRCSRRRLPARAAGSPAPRRRRARRRQEAGDEHREEDHIRRVRADRRVPGAGQLARIH